MRDIYYLTNTNSQRASFTTQKKLFDSSSFIDVLHNELHRLHGVKTYHFLNFLRQRG